MKVDLGQGRALPRGGASGGALTAAALGPPLPAHQRAVLAHQQIEMGAFFVGKLEKDLLAFGVFETLPVLLEEAMRAALAADANQQRLLIVDATDETIGTVSKQAV